MSATSSVGGQVARAHDDAADHGVGLVEVLADESPDGGVALGDERAAVEQARRSRAAASTSISTIRAPRASSCATAAAKAPAGVVAQILELRRPRARRPAARAGRRAGRRPATGAPSGSPGAGPVMCAMASSAPARSAAKTLTQSSVRHAGTTPSTGTSPNVGLSPTMPLEGGRHAARAGGVGAEREVGDPERDRDRRAGARAARRRGRAGARRAPRRTGSGCRRARWRTGQVRLAEHDRARAR